MENMKRAISAFMALVLLLGMLPGVPMFAGAEEVETLPETVAVETTEAVTASEETEVPETTAAVETVPETTAAAETVPEEPVPETTVAQETVPEETVPETTEAQETVPGETVPVETVPEETIPEETVGELTADAEAADAVVPVPVTDIQVKASKTETFVGDKVQLTATVSPAGASYPEVVFYVVPPEEGDPIAYDADLLAEKGILRVSEPGTITVAARATDTDMPHDSIAQEEGGTVTVKFSAYSMEINREKALFAQENIYELNEEETEVDSLKVMTGKKVKVSVHYMIDGKVSIFPDADLKWYLEEEDEKYASLSASDDGKEVTLTGKTVTSTKTVILYVKDESINKVDQIQVTVYPVPYKVGIYDEEGTEYTNKTLTIPLLASEMKTQQAEGKNYLEVELTAKIWPEEAMEPMVWESSNDLVIVKHPPLGDGEELAEDEEAEEPEEDTTRATLRVYFQEGKTTIKVSSKNYPDVVSKIIIERKFCLEQENLDKDKATEELSTKGEGLIAGKSFQLKVYDVRDEKNPVLLDSETVKWSLSDEDQAYATVSANGKLTAKKGITSGKEITVNCAVIGNEDACLEIPVIIRPLADEVQILAGDLGAEEALSRMAKDDIINGKTIPVDTTDGCAPFQLGYKLLPDDLYGAKQDVKWKSSNTDIATVDNDTDEIIWEGKNGTVTITATATDGSGKSATVKLKFGKMVRGITIVKDEEDFFLRSGQSWTFKVNFDPVKPTSKSLTWALVGENDKKYASISSSGKLTAKTVYEEHTVTIRATAKDGSGVFDEETVIIKPKKDGILTLKKVETVEGAEVRTYVTKTTQTIPVGDTIDLEAYILNDTELADVKWKLSSTKNAVLSETIGGTTTVTMKGTGTVTVTATDLNDTSRKTTVTLKGVRITDKVEWIHDHEKTALACGKSLTLKAKAYDAEGKTPTVSKLAWSIEQDGKYAKVSNGKVTAIAGAVGPYDEPKVITVVASATDGSGKSARYPITIHPIVQSVVVSASDDENLYLNMPSSGKNTYIMEAPGEDTLELSAQVWPAKAMDSVTWKSSDKNIASVGKNSGEVTFKKTGTVTITATAADGSGKKATFKLTILLRPTEIEFQNLHDPAVIAGGKSLKLKPILRDENGKKVTGKKLQWKVLPVEGEEDDGTAYVTSISGGTLKTKKVTEPKKVLVTVQTVEKYDSWESEVFELEVTIYPVTESVKITEEDGTVAKSSRWCNLADEGLVLGAVTEAKNGEESCPYVTWKSSDKKIAEVDSEGNVIFHKSGTVTITATAADGSGEKDTIKLYIRK